MVNSNQNSFTLNENDAMYFLHIPKTAGTTFISILDDFFDFNSILQKQSWDELLPFSPKNLKQYKFFRGHFGYGLYHQLDMNFRYITMLRDPVERTISDFEHYKRTSLSDLQNLGPGPLVIDFFTKNNDLYDFLSDPLYHKFLKNTQTRFIGLDLDVFSIFNSYANSKFFYLACPDFLSPSISDVELIDIAKQHLSKFTFVGITEELEKSLFLLCYTFGWKPIENIPMLNVAEKRIKKEKLTQNELEKVLECTRLDYILYDYARKLFEERYLAMEQYLKKNYFDSRLSQLSNKDMMKELLERHYEACFTKSKVNLLEYIEYDFRQKISGSGWYAREDYNNTGIKFRWTGPSTISVIDLPLVKDNDLQIKIHVILCLSEDILKSLILKVNDYSIPTLILYDSNGYTIEGTVSKSILQNSKPLTRLSICVSQTISPNSIDPSSNDMRLLGVAIDSIKIFPSEKRV